MDKIEISHKTIIFTVFFLISLWFLYQIRQLIIFSFICLIFAIAFSPIIDKMEKFKIPRPLAIILFYFLLIGGFISAVISISPLLISQTSALIQDFPKFLNNAGFFKLGIKLDDYSDHLAKIPASIFKIAASAFSNLIKVFAFLIINFYLLMERKNLKKHLHFLFNENGEKKLEKLILKLENKLGGWVRGQALLMVIVGLMSYLGLKLLDLDFVLPLALIAGFLELIPNLGPTISMIPALIIGFSSSPLIGLAVFALYILIQQVENNLIVPKIMQKAVGLHPLVTLFALMAGFSFGGIGGSLLAIPTVLFIKIVIEQFYLPLKSFKKPFKKRSKIA